MAIYGKRFARGTLETRALCVWKGRGRLRAHMRGAASVDSAGLCPSPSALSKRDDFKLVTDVCAVSKAKYAHLQNNSKFPNTIYTKKGIPKL